MNVVFLNAALTGFLALALLPLLVHLFARARPPEYRFSSNTFIRRVVRETMRVRKPREWLLLLLRTLAVLALILAFLRPFWFPQKPVGGVFQKRNVVFIVDATASMAAVEGAQTRFSAACAEVAHGLSGLSASDTADILWMRAAPEAVFPALSNNLRYLQDAARRATVSSETGAIAPALKRALDLLENAEGRREIRVISDFQQSAWAGVETAVPKGVELQKIQVSHEEARNTGIIRLRCEPESPVTGEEVVLFCDIRNYSPQARHCSVYFSGGETRQSQEVLLGEWGAATAVCRVKAGRPGPMAVSAALDEDNFPGDDKRWAVVPVRESLRVGIYETPECPDPALAATWRKALAALGWARVEKVSALDSGDPLDILMLAGWTGEGTEAVQSRMQAGTAVICFPAPTAAALAAVAKVTGAAPEPGPALRWEEAAEHTLRLADNKADLFRIFTQGNYGDPSRGHLRARLTGGRWRENAAPLLEYDDGVPALARLGKNAAFTWWNLPVDARWSDWAGQAEFIPLFGELLATCRARTGAGESGIEAGEPATARIEHEALLSEITLADDTGAACPVVAKGADGRGFASRDPLKPGLYAWNFRQTPIAYSAVNFPAIESDLRALPAAEVTRGNALATLGGHLLQDANTATPLWPWLLALGCLLLVAEGGVLLCKD
ncbi:MAG: VWA domain-containing protein [Chthoniobacteraceae bacterium]|nr:VWA domain-containing protein [Chthoniobacteraceae bacterium]